MCFGCGHVDRMANKKRAGVEKDNFLQKPRSKKNLCSQPWHLKFKDASERKSIRRDNLIKKYKILSDEDVSKFNVVVKNFNRKKVKTSGKQTYKVNRLTVAN